MRRWFVGLAVVLWLALPGWVGRSSLNAGQAGPARDRQGEAKGTGVIRGIVVADDNQLPVRRAEVSLLVRAPSNGPTRPTSQTTTTDAEGRFEFTAVPPGLITLRANKGGYFNQDDADAGSGTTRPQPEPRSIAAGQTLDGQTIRLLRAGAIVGRIVDEFGEPVEGMDVEVLRRVPTSDGPRWTPAGRSRFGSISTDDTGAFRVWNLPPGRYVVMATSGRFQVMSRLADTDRQGFAPTYFPGTPRLSDAGLVTVAGGRDTSGVSFALATAPLATVRGTVLSIDGQLLGNVSLSVSRVDPDRLDSSSSGGGDVNSDGSFKVTRLAPGRYRLSVSNRWMPYAGPGAARSFGSTEVEIDGSDVDGVTIPLRPGSVLSGRLIGDSGGPPPSSASLQVSLVPFDRAFAAPGLSPPVAVKADGSFRFDGVFGKLFLRVFSTARPAPSATGATTAMPSEASTPAPANTWFMTAVTLDGRNVIDVPLEFDGRPVDVAVSVTTRPAVVSGTVTWSQVATAKPPTVVVFVDDPSRWHREARSIRSVAVGADGRFRIRGLPVDDRYLAVAVEGLELVDARQPSLLAARRSAATPLRIDEGGTHEVTLRAVPRPSQ
jgi:hypothetical protein